MGTAGTLLDSEQAPAAAAAIGNGDMVQALTPAAADVTVDPITAIVQQVQAVISGIVEAVAQVINQVVTVVNQFVTAIVNIFVPAAQPNSAPTAISPSVGSPDLVTGAVTGTVSAVDADGDTLTYTAPANTSKGGIEIDSNSGAFTYTPTVAARENAAQAGATAADKTDSFTVSVSDGKGGSVSVPVSVAISPMASAPTNASPIVGAPTVGAPDAVTGVVTGKINASDPDGDSLTYSGPLSTSKGNVAINPGTGTFVYTPTDTARAGAAQVGAGVADKSDTFVITVSDGEGGSTTASVTVTIAPAVAAPGNRAPVAEAPTVGTPDPGTGVVVGRISATDPDGDTLVYGGSTTTSKGSVIVSSDGSFTYTPNATARRNAYLRGESPNDVTDAFNVTVSDGAGASISVPVAAAISPAITEYVTGDIKRDPVTGRVALRTVFPESTPQPGTETPGWLTWLVATSSAGADIGTTAEVASWDDLYLVGTVPVTNPYGQSVSMPTNSVLRNPQTGAVAIRTIFDQAEPAFADMTWLIATSSQGALNVSSASVDGWDILFVPGNPPTIVGYSINDPEPNGVVTGRVDATDAGGDALTYSAPVSTAKGYVVIDADSGAFTYAPIAAARQVAAQPGAAPADQSDSFVVTVSDGYFTSEAVVNVVIDPAPALQAGDIRAQPGGTWRVIYAPNVSVGGDWVGVNPANGGQWFTDAEVSRWLDVAPPTGAETSSGGPYSPGDIKVPPGSVAGAVTFFAVKSGPPLSNIHNWMVCSTVNACGGVSGDGTYGSSVPVAQWVDLRLPLTSAAPSNL